jgi:hypothetical protein
MICKMSNDSLISLLSISSICMAFVSVVSCISGRTIPDLSQCVAIRKDEYEISDTSFFLRKEYNEFRRSTSSEVLYYTKDLNTKNDEEIIEISRQDDKIVAQRIRQDFKSEISLTSNEKKEFDSLIDKTELGRYIQQCSNLPLHPTITLVFIKVNGVEKVVYISYFGSPLHLDQTSKDQLGNTYRIMELAYTKKYQSKQDVRHE